MREQIVFVLLLGMLVAFGAAVAVPGIDGARATADVGATPPSVVGTPQKPAPRGEPRTVRVVAVGYDVLAPGIVANGGLGSESKESVFRGNGIDARFRVVGDDDAIASALALGGEVDGGAHVAVLPLPTLIAHEERLRALELSVVHVAAWSNGRHVLRGPSTSDGSAITALGSDEAKRERIAVVGSSGDAAAILALTLFDLAGVEASQVRFVDAGGSGSRSTEWSIGDGSARVAPRGVVVASSADAPRLIPYVMVVPAAEVRRDPEAIGRFLASWCEGGERLRRDPAGVARSLSEHPDAPDAVAMIERLGELELVGPRESARVLGLAGRSPVTIDALHAHSARLLRTAGATASQPVRSLVAREPIAYAVRADAGGRDGQRFTAERAARTTPLVRYETGLRGDELVTRVGFVAGVFDSERVGLATPGHERGRTRLVEEVTDRYDLDAERFGTASAARTRGATVVELY